jgi:hypothetical protein
LLIGRRKKQKDLLQQGREALEEEVELSMRA